MAFHRLHLPVMCPAFFRMRARQKTSAPLYCGTLRRTIHDKIQKVNQVSAFGNLAKHGVTFAQAATVMLDPLALTVFDAVHSETEAR